MKHLSLPRWLAGSLLIIVAMLIAFEPVSAQNPSDGDMTIQSEEISFTASDFANNGTLDGLEANSNGLIIANSNSDGTYTFADIQAPIASTTDILPLWKAEIPDGASLDVEVRVRVGDSEWSEWETSPETAYPVGDDEHSGTLLWVGGGQVVAQVRVNMQKSANGESPVLQSLRLSFNNEVSEEDGDTETAWYRPCPVKVWRPPCFVCRPILFRPIPIYRPVYVYPTWTPIATPVPATPVPTDTNMEASQILAINFDKTTYQVGETINLTVHVANLDGTPLSGAEITMEVRKEAIALSDDTAISGFVDGVGQYTGSYSNTDVPGLYEFTITAADPTGTRFYSSSDKKTVLVIDGTTNNPTPTHTPTTSPGTITPTPSPTLTPSPTPTTPVETGTTLLFSPANINLNTETQTTVQIQNATDVKTLDLLIKFNPSVVKVASLDVSNTVFSNTMKLANIDNTTMLDLKYDNTAGTITLAGAVFSANGFVINGTQDLLVINWEKVSDGSSNITFTKSDLADGNGTRDDLIQVTTKTGTVGTASTTVNGQINLQGRQDYSGVTITSADGQVVNTQADGSFSLSGDEEVSVQFDGYLSAKAESGMGVHSSNGGTVSISLGKITLLAGDINGDNQINILDISTIANNYGTSNAIGDLNGDGKVTIVDISLAASNYQQAGPLMNWQ